MFSVEPAVPAPPIAQRVPQWCFIFKTPGNIWPAVLLQDIIPRDFFFHLSLPCSQSSDLLGLLLCWCLLEGRKRWPTIMAREANSSTRCIAHLEYLHNIKPGQNSSWSFFQYFAGDVGRWSGYGALPQKYFLENSYSLLLKSRPML